MFGTTVASAANPGTIGSTTFGSSDQFTSRTLSVSQETDLAGHINITGPLTLSGTLSLTGNATFTGNLIAGTDNLYNLGSSAVRWASLHSGPTGLIVHNDTTDTNKVSLVFSGANAVLGTDAATPLQITTGVNDGITVQTSGAIDLGGNTSVTGTNTFTTGTGLVTMNGDLIVNGDTTLNGLTVTNNTLTSNAQATFTKAPTLAHVFVPSWPTGTSNAADGTIYINPASSVADGNLISAAVNGSIQFLVDAEGDIYGNNLVLSGSTTTGATTIAGNLTVQDSTQLGDAPTDQINVVGKFISNLSPNVDNTYDLGTSALRWKTLHLGPGSLVVHNDNTNTNKVSLQFSLGTALLASDAATPLQITTGVNNGITVDTAGKVGINDTTPSYQLDVAGTSRFTDAVTLDSTINKVTITAPATGSTLTIADGKTFTASNTLTFTGTDGSSVAFGTGGTVTYTSNKLSVFSATSSAELAGVISDETGSGVLVFNNSPSLTTPTFATSLTASGSSVITTDTTVAHTLKLQGYTGTVYSDLLTITNAATPTISIADPTLTGHPTIEGITSTGATGSGKFVFDNSPTLVTPNIGAATATTINGQTISSVASFTGTLAAASTITGTTLNGTTGINTGAGVGTQRIDASGNLVNIGTITSGLINGQTISSAANFTGTLAVASTISAPTHTVTGGSSFMAGNVAQNMKLKGGGGTDVGITGYNSADTWVWQLYGSGTSYGFLNANWGGWDMQKVVNGALTLNGGSGAISAGLYNGQTISSAANFTGSVTAASNFAVGNHVFDSNQDYCNGGVACYYNWSGSGVTNVGNSTGGTVNLGNGLATVTGGTYNGQTISSAANFTGSMTLASGLSIGGPIYRTSATGGYLNGQYPSVEGAGNTPGAIYTIGGSYVPTAGGLGIMYGIGYGYSGGTAGITASGAPANNWGMYVASGGTPRVFLDSDNGSVYINGSYNGSGSGLTGTAASLTAGAANSVTFNGGLTTTSDPTFNSVYLANGNLRLYQGPGTSLHVATAYGSMDLGAENASWTHMYATLPFYFNQNLYVNGTQVVTNSGTWGISISGNAATASLASTATIYTGRTDAAYYQAMWTTSGSTTLYSTDNVAIYSGGYGAIAFNSHAWTLEGNASYGLYSNTGLDANGGLWDAGNRVCSSTTCSVGSIVAASLAASGAVSGSSLSTSGSVSSGGATLAANGDISGRGIVGRGGVNGTSNGNMFNFTYNGSCIVEWVDVTAVTTNECPSDMRVKKNIETLHPGLTELMELRPVSFNWKNPDSETNLQFGLIAQEVEPILPNLVTNTGMITPDTPDGMLRIKYDGLIPIAIKAIQELSSRTSAVYQGSDLSAGDLVKFEDGSSTTVEKAAADGSSIGVITDATIDRVQFSGQASVKVSEENGQINAGDKLTLSKIQPGYAMKMTESGQSIGTALQNFSDSSANDTTTGLGMIQGMISIGYQHMDVAQNDSGKLVTTAQDLDMNNFSILNVKSILAASGKWSIDENGNLAVAGHITVGKDTAGSITIPSGASSIQVSFVNSYAYAPKVVITPQGETGTYWIGEKSAAGFTIHLSQPATADTEFDWVALAGDPSTNIATPSSGSDLLAPGTAAAAPTDSTTTTTSTTTTDTASTSPDTTTTSGITSTDTSGISTDTATTTDSTLTTPTDSTTTTDTTATSPSDTTSSSTTPSTNTTTTSSTSDTAAPPADSGTTSGDATPTP